MIEIKQSRIRFLLIERLNFSLEFTTLSLQAGKSLGAIAIVRVGNAH